MKFSAVAFISAVALPLAVASTPVSNVPSSRTIAGSGSTPATFSGEINGVAYVLSLEGIKVAGRTYPTAQPTVVHGAGHTLTIGADGEIQIDGTSVPTHTAQPTHTPDVHHMLGGEEHDYNNNHYGDNHDGDNHFGDNHDGDNHFGDNHIGNNHYGDNHLSLSQLDDIVHGDKTVSNNVVSDNENSVGVINTGDYNKIFSTNIVGSFNNNTINYYKDNSKYYYAKFCNDCSIVKVKGDCDCYTMKPCTTCAVLTQHVTFHKTMHMTQGVTHAVTMPMGTATMGPATVTQMGSVSYQCPMGECPKPTQPPMLAQTHPVPVAMPMQGTAMPLPTSAMSSPVSVLPVAPFQNVTMPAGQPAGQPSRRPSGQSAGVAQGTTITVRSTANVQYAPTIAPSASGQGPTPSSLPPFMGSAMASKAPLFFAATVAVFGSVLIL